MRHFRDRSDRGFVVPVAIGALVLFAIYGSFLMMASRGELNLTARRIKQERARLIAESAIEMARALVFQNEFQRRWYRQDKIGHKRYGWRGTMKGALGGGTFLVVGEDVTNSTKDFSVSDLASIKKLTYNRVDLFAEGRYEDCKVVVYKALFWHPEERVFEWDETPTNSVDPSTGTTLVRYDNFRQR